MSSTGVKGSQQTNTSQKKGFKTKEQSLPKAALVWRIELSGVPPEQWLLHTNGRLQRTLNALQCAPARAEVRADARRHTGQSTGPVRCTTGLSGGPTSQSSNGRNPTAS
jgi:hypothetical protein